MPATLLWISKRTNGYLLAHGQWMERELMLGTPISYRPAYKKNHKCFSQLMTPELSKCADVAIGSHAATSGFPELLETMSLSR
jgi:hypothetical protein